MYSTVVGGGDIALHCIEVGFIFHRVTPVLHHWKCERQTSTTSAPLNYAQYYAERFDQHLQEQEQHFSTLRESVERGSSEA